MVKVNHKAEFKIPYIGREATKIQWYKDGEELSVDTNCKIEINESYCRLSLYKLQRKDTGEIKIKIKNEFGTVEATSTLVILGKSTKLMLLELDLFVFCISSYSNIWS